jgi:alpha-beta hydrolase superfamily lysophospholipase
MYWAQNIAPSFTMRRFFKALVGFLLVICLGIFVFINWVAYVQAYRFTHFVPSNPSKGRISQTYKKLDQTDTLIWGVFNPRPINKTFPRLPYARLDIYGAKRLEAWWIRTQHGAPKGNVILFHGYTSDKSQMLDKAEEFEKMGYHTLLVDFRGSGGSEGDETTIGYHEAEDVKAAFDYLRSKNALPIYLYGTSMGAVAVLKAIKEYNLPAQALFLDCPFASMYQAVEVRIRDMGLPTNPTTTFLMFWGGFQQGFWGFDHNPTEYARAVKMPTLMFWGEKDPLVSREEVGSVFANLYCPKRLVFLPQSHHADYLAQNRPEWIAAVKLFLDQKLK